MTSRVRARPAVRRGKTAPSLVSLGRRIRQACQRGNFLSFCSSVPIHTRKAYDLIAIADAVDDGRLPEMVVQEIGWSKARLIAERARSKSETRRAIDFARRNTLPAVVSYFKQNGAGPALVTKSFHLTEDQAKEVEAALVSAGARRLGRRIVNRTEALMQVVRAYGASSARTTIG